MVSHGPLNFKAIFFSLSQYKYDITYTFFLLKKIYLCHFQLKSVRTIKFSFLFNAKWLVKFRENGNDLLIFLLEICLIFFIDQFLLFAL